MAKQSIIFAISDDNNVIVNADTCKERIMKKKKLNKVVLKYDKNVPIWVLLFSFLTFKVFKMCTAFFRCVKFILGQILYYLLVFMHISLMSENLSFGTRL